MKHLQSFESLFNRPEKKPKPDKPGGAKRCIGKCKREMFLKDEKPVIHCSSCGKTFGQ